jgi:hypothetical protein
MPQELTCLTQPSHECCRAAGIIDPQAEHVKCGRPFSPGGSGKRRLADGCPSALGKAFGLDRSTEPANVLKR